MPTDTCVPKAPGVVVLERLSEAHKNGHAVLAVIRGTAVNQDGRSNGLTAPNGPSQQAVIRAALRRAGVAPAEVGYVECHGTGTALGDPIEVQALGAEFGEGRDLHHPLLIGSVKTNVGHMEGAAGVGGLMKAVLALQHGRIPKSLHFTSPSPHIAWSELAIRVASEATDWPSNGAPRIAGVSSFGISGTNAHLLVAEAPASQQHGLAPVRAAELVVLSAATEAGLRAVSQRLSEHLRSNPAAALGDVAYSLATTRSLMERRLSFVAPTRQALLDTLDGLGRGGTASGATIAEIRPSRGKLAWLFTGQGAQKLGMGRQLHEEWRVFREALEAAFAALDPHLEMPLRAVMWAAADTAPAALLDQTAYTQPALFAFEWALAALWRSWGVQPDFVAGHSIGEITAACVAGVFSLEDAARLVCARGRLMQALPSGGAMVAIASTKGSIADVLGSRSAQASIAAINAPSSVVISGDEATVMSVAGHFAALGVETKRLTVSHAFHSALMDPMLEAFRRVAETLRYRAPLLALVSNLSGELAGSEVGTAEYWVEHVRKTVRFADGLRALQAAGAGSFLEIGPKAILLPLVAATLSGPTPLLFSSGRPSGVETEVALGALGRWLTDGGKVDWRGVFPDGGQRLALPTYPWQREKYWIEASYTARAAGTATLHPLLGVRMASGAADAVYESLLNAADPAWLSQRRVADRVHLPEAAFVELMRAAAEDLRRGVACEVRGMVSLRPLLIRKHGVERVQVVLTEGGTRASLYSQPAEAASGDAWTLHTTAELTAASELVPTRLDIDALRARCSEAQDVTTVSAALAATGLEYGPAFQSLKHLWVGPAEAMAEVRLAEGLDVDRYGVHPILLEAALQTIMVLSGIQAAAALLAFEFGRFTVHQLGASSGLVRARLVEPVAPDHVLADLTLADAGGNIVAQLSGVRMRRADAREPRQDETGSIPDALYRIEWPGAPAAADPRTVSGRWVVVSMGDEAEAGSLVEGLRQRGASANQVLISELHDRVADHVVCAWGMPGDGDAAMRAAEQGLSVAHALNGHENAPRLWWLTRGAVAAQPDENVAVAGSTVWGLGRTLMQERPELRCTLVDLDRDAVGAEVLAREQLLDDGETQVACRAGQRQVARLARAADEIGKPSRKTSLLPMHLEQLRPNGTVLVTGGLGALGLEVAKSLARRGVQHLLLTGRRGLSTPGAAAAVSELEALGASVTVEAVDVADRDTLADVLARVPAKWPLRGVVHAAGLVDDGLLSQQTPERFARVLSPKVSGAWNLHTLTEQAELDWFVLFSSIAGTLGSAGQGAYAAGNSFLDALASHRRAQGQVGISLAWGPWAERGLAAELDSQQQARFARQGLSMITPRQGVALFEAAIARPEAQLVLAPIDVRSLAKSFGAGVPPFWQALVRTSVWRAAGAKGTWARELVALSVAERAVAVTSAVQTEVARVLSLPSPGAVPVDKPLKDLGLDSLMAVELGNALSRRTGAIIPATLAFNHPTAAKIADYLLSEVLALAEPVTPPAVVPRAALDEPIAIVGMACRFPGGVTDPESFWRLLNNGVDAVSEVPRERFEIDDWYDPDPAAVGKMTSRWGGFLQNIEQFEPSFFGISPREAASVDPQERLLLETTWEALERAGLKPDSLMGSNTGVYMGLCGAEYQARVMADTAAIDGYSISGTAHSTMVGRLSYWLGLMGPNMPIDTACSSSLVAVHLASQALRSGECNLALAGGANVVLGPEASVGLSRLHALSPTGRCRTFSADADGYVRSEGAGVVVLERLAEARKNGHPILGLIRGTAVNQDGRSNGLTAPNGPSQQAVIREALRRGGVAPSEVGYVECHGTGTALGDPIEVQALGAELGQGRDPKHPLVLGSVKTNLGHMEGAAGVGGLMKAVLSLQHGRIPKSLHFSSPNPHIAWSELPVRVAAESMAWPRNGAPRIAGISSFGISGTNAHVLVEEAPAPEPRPAAPLRSAELVALSAPTEAGLRAASRRLSEYLRSTPEATLGDVAHSLATTRSLMERRLSLVAPTRQAAIAALDGFADGKMPAELASGQVQAHGKLAWLFTGQGAQKLGMGQELHREWPAFRQALDAAFAALDPHLETPLRDVMWAAEHTAAAARLDQTAFTQPALFAFEWALALLWRSWGVQPDFVAGHSIGEITAACLAGVFSLEDAARLVCERGRLMQALPNGGAMVAIAASDGELADALGSRKARVAIAAINAPASVVISGEEAAVMSVAESLRLAAWAPSV